MSYFVPVYCPIHVFKPAQNDSRGSREQGIASPHEIFTPSAISQQTHVSVALDPWKQKQDRYSLKCPQHTYSYPHKKLKTHLLGSGGGGGGGGGGVGGESDQFLKFVIRSKLFYISHNQWIHNIIYLPASTPPPPFPTNEPERKWSHHQF